MIDSHLNWKSWVNYISKKIKRNIGILSKLRHYVKTLTNLFYSLISIFDLWSYCLGEHLQINFNPIYQFTKKEFFESLLFLTTVITLTLSSRLLK